MKTKIYFSKFIPQILMLLYILISAGCSEEIISDTLTGKVIGRVFLYDKNRASISDRSGVSVTVEGSSPEITVHTDESGEYEIDYLSSGTYNLKYEKDGFGEYVILGYSFIGGSEPTNPMYGPNLYELVNTPNTSFELIKYEHEYVNVFGIEIKGTFENPEDIPYPQFRCYLSNSPNVSYKDYVETIELISLQEGLISNEVYVPDTIRFPVGTELYGIVYPQTIMYNHTDWDYTYYYDLETGKKIYNSVNINLASDVVSVTIPDPSN